ncbi:hypothetical protein BT63DRAFT_457403 [Microthyrium microscopicum]|uniref:Formamidopyrimidine-DNA glycosylase catalytic domain-containing protein n=1 Tax=Microthyrium microscopicum TaxID=703497 RepID=A0A6A6U7H8_9PEZI|nr:hypothetical protein BT63DRAFT_457403 [Microthyrium microscopicum]
MPEIGEVHRLVHFLRRHVINRKIVKIHTQEDTIVYGKVGCSASQFQSSLVNKTVVDVKQQGKYFWLVMGSPPHPLMHLGMTGWIVFSNDDTAYYRPKTEETVWPPKFWKFRLVMEGKPECEVAFVDPRRLGRIRLVDVAADKMRLTAPLSENGPDPVVDKDVFTKEWFREKIKSKRVPIKALLLDQHNISGIGNWVADEVMYQSRTHPEQYSNTFSDEQADRIHDKIVEVCGIACDTLADSEQFPENWMMRHRWGQGKKNANTLPNGEKMVFIKVGGRTSAVVPSVQKKTGAVAGDITEETITGDEDGATPAKGRKKAAKTKKALKDDDEEEENTKTPVKARKKATKPTKDVGKEDDSAGESEEEQVKPKSRKKAMKASAKAKDEVVNKISASSRSKRKTIGGDGSDIKAKKIKAEKPAPAEGTRRSSRRST